MNKAKVLMCPEKGKVELQDIEIPQPDKEEIQVRVHASLISPGTERAFALGLANAVTDFPWPPGYCTAGVVEAVGTDIKRFKVGDRVVAAMIGHRSLGNAWEPQVIPVAEGVPFDKAVFMPLGVVALQGVRKARIEVGEGVLVQGLGIIGQLALQYSQLNGGLPVVGLDRVENRLQIASKCGADAVFNGADKKWKDKLMEMTGGEGPQVLIESTGVPEAVADAFQTVRKFGRVVMLGSTRGDSTINFYRDVHKKALTIYGAHISANASSESRPGYWTWLDDAACFMRTLKAGKLKIDPLTTEKISWKKAEETYRSMLKGNTDMVGTVINWE